MKLLLKCATSENDSSAKIKQSCLLTPAWWLKCLPTLIFHICNGADMMVKTADIEFAAASPII